MAHSASQRLEGRRDDAEHDGGRDQGPRGNLPFQLSESPSFLRRHSFVDLNTPTSPAQWVAEQADVTAEVIAGSEYLHVDSPLPAKLTQGQPGLQKGSRRTKNGCGSGH